jgi:rhodanese-related sulfurtransferase
MLDAMVKAVPPTELSALLSDANAQLIDVRDHGEWEAGHLDGARSLPLEQLRADPERELPAGATLVFVCAKGVRSLAAAKLAERLGYSSVYSIDGGTAACARAGFRLVAERAAA